MKNIIVVTGGAGFIGSNLIEQLVLSTKYNIISIDNYSSGTKNNHINSTRVKYFKNDTKNISKILHNIRSKINSIFHFGEFSRIYQSFKKTDICFDANIAGTANVFNFALNNNIRVIYSATSASLGNNGSDMNLSPYSFSKAKNVELLENLKRWFNFRCEIVYFYNVYGPRQINKGDMAAVIGIFERLYKKKKPLPVVSPGSQMRRFTHVTDTISGCLLAWKNKKNAHYCIVNKESFSILDIAKMFTKRIVFLPSRPGERFVSTLIKKNLNRKVINIWAKIKLRDYISNFTGNKLFNK